MKKNKDNYFSYFLVAGVLITISICYFITNHFDCITTWFPIGIAIVAIILTLIITIKQHIQIVNLNNINKSVLSITLRQPEQLKELSSINKAVLEITEQENKQIKDLNEITRQLRIEKDITLKVQQIFPVRSSEEEYFHCYFPVQYINSPLPVIFEGDFFAMQVLKDYLKDKLKYKAVLFEEDYQNNKKIDEGNIIFICTPWVNSALRSKYPPYEDNRRPEFLNDKSLPCWFAEKTDSISNEKEKVIRIFGKEKNDDIDLPSPAEPIYKEYQKVLNKGEVEIEEFFKKASEKTIQDFGIFARLSTNSGKHTIIAGIHQYGTWIVGEYVKKLLTKEIEDENPFLSRNEDFVSIIYGEFHALGLNVENANIYCNWSWFKEGDKWVRCS